jgi:hypothetical protein
VNVPAAAYHFLAAAGAARKIKERNTEENKKKN